MNGVTEPAESVPTPAQPNAANPGDAAAGTGADIGGGAAVPRRALWRRVGRGLFEWAKSASLAVILFFVLRAFLVEAFKIPSGSMERTLLVGDFLLVNKLVYGAEVPFTGKRLPAFRTPQQGDILVFQWPNDLEKNLVKRLVGVPGDTLAMRGGVLLRNGVEQDEPFIKHVEPNYDPSSVEFDWQGSFLVRTAGAAQAYHATRDNWGPIVVPPQQYFVLGDNRDNSYDSRYWGFVPDSLVRGRPLLVYYSYVPDSADALDWVKRVRWHRLFSRID
ncbi:MAG: signal peptidase I [Gemmatimonadetes bacterium]|nr:signal peptidase I [Gemmatimonadota bacterium]